MEVAVLPQLLQNAEKKTCIVIDVLRASTTLVTMLEQGARSIVLAGGVEAARQVCLGSPDALLCGEHGGVAPEGFHYGNSPVEYDSLDLAGKNIVFATSNGTKALAAVSDSPDVMIGCFLNASAVVETALARERDIALICAGRGRGSAYGLDDVVCAGYLTGLIMSKVEIGSATPPVADYAQLISGGDFATSSWFIDESAVAAYRLYSSYHGDVLAAFRDSGNGKALIQLGLEDDLHHCAKVDNSQVVPVLRRTRGGLEVARQAEFSTRRSCTG